MLWVTQSMGKFWQSYRDGLSLSCPVRHVRLEADERAIDGYHAIQQAKFSPYQPRH